MYGRRARPGQPRSDEAQLVPRRLVSPGTLFNSRKTFMCTDHQTLIVAIGKAVYVPWKRKSVLKAMIAVSSNPSAFCISETSRLIANVNLRDLLPMLFVSGQVGQERLIIDSHRSQPSNHPDALGASPLQIRMDDHLLPHPPQLYPSRSRFFLYRDPLWIYPPFRPRSVFPVRVASGKSDPCRVTRLCLDGEGKGERQGRSRGEGEKVGQVYLYGRCQGGSERVDEGGERGRARTAGGTVSSNDELVRSCISGHEWESCSYAERHTFMRIALPTRIYSMEKAYKPYAAIIEGPWCVGIPILCS